MTAFKFELFHTLTFAGGGNRCWWQGGAIAELLEYGHSLPPELVGTSAGAAVAASFLTDGPQAALEACKRLYAENAHIFNWRALSRLQLNFAHQSIYPAWIRSFIHANNFDRVKHARTTLHVAISRPARILGLAMSVAAGTAAYFVDKKIWHSIHPRLPRFLGLRQEFLHLRDCDHFQEAQALLIASAAAPPFMHSIRLRKEWAFDGGYIDNAPITGRTPDRRASTLVLLSRHYPDRPHIFTLCGATYWQPSRPVPVSTWDCTHRATVEDAFELGRSDARRLLGC